MNTTDILLQVFRTEFLDGLASLPDRLAKDKARIEAFFEAFWAKLAELAADAIERAQAGDSAGAAEVINRADALRRGGQKLLGEAAGIGVNLSKFQFPKDLFSSKYRDPFAGWAARVKLYAAENGLDARLQNILR